VRQADRNTDKLKSREEEISFYQKMKQENENGNKKRNSSLVKKVENEKKRKRINCQTQKRRFRFIRKDIFSIWMFHKKALKRSFFSLKLFLTFIQHFLPVPIL